MSEPHDRPTVVVAGGGIGGLTAAFQLAARGCRPVVLESGPRVGGAVARHTVGGIDLDAGAESFATASPAVADLLGELGLAERIVPPAPLGSWVRHEGGTHPLPGTSLLGIPGRVLSAPVRQVIGPGGAARAMLDRLLPPRVTGRTLGALVRRRMGERVLHRLVEAVVGGVHAADPSVLEVDTVAPGLSAAMGTNGSLAGAVLALRGGHSSPGSAVAGIRGGMATLPDALAASIGSAGGEIICDAEVSGLSFAFGQWQVRAGRRRQEAAGVVLALPAAATTSLLGPVLPGAALPATDTGTDVAVVTLVLRTAVLGTAPRGTGILVAPRSTGVRAKALTHVTAKWPWLAETVPDGTEVLRLSYGRGGFADPALSAIPPERELPGIALTDAASLLGVRLPESAVIDSAVVRWPSSLPQARAGHAAATAALRSALGTRHGLAAVGAAVAGTGLAAVVADARTQAEDLAERLLGR